VEAIGDGIREGDLAHTELFICTDNSTVEGAYYKGNTDSPLLFDLVLHLRQIDLNGLVRLHVIHIAGTRMVAQGTDALSRGDLTSGVMQGVPMPQFLPFHLSVTNRCPLVLPWIHTWAPVPSLLPLQPEGWYGWGQGFDGGDYGPGGLWYPHPISETWLLWDAAPGSASIILDQLSLSRLKCTHLNHIFICPRLLTQYWRRNLHKICDIILEIPAGCRPFWPRSMHEPLLLGLTLCFTYCAPWQLRQSTSIFEREQTLHKVWHVPGQDERPFLHKLCDLPQLLEALC
jgi:hypothetical protein